MYYIIIYIYIYISIMKRQNPNIIVSESKRLKENDKPSSIKTNLRDKCNSASDSMIDKIEPLTLENNTKSN